MFFSKINVTMEEVGWCASPRGCGPRTDVAVPAETVAPVVVSPDSGIVPPVEEMPTDYVPPVAPPVEEIPTETIHIESNGIAPEVQEITNTTVDHAIESFFSSLLAGGIKFLIIGLLLLGAFMLIKYFMKTSAVRAQEFAAAKQAALIKEARENAKVKEALEAKDKIERARKKRRMEEIKRQSDSSSAVVGFSLEDLSVPTSASLPDLTTLKITASNYFSGESVVEGGVTKNAESTFASYTSDLSLSSYSSPENPSDSSNATIVAPGKRSDNPFSQYL